MPDGTVALNNLAPGRYWVLAQAVLEDASPLAKMWLPDATRLRATLRREAKAGKLEIEALSKGRRLCSTPEIAKPSTACTDKSA